jgi:hypothetical protein
MANFGMTGTGQNFVGCIYNLFTENSTSPAETSVLTPPTLRTDIATLYRDILELRKEMEKAAYFDDEEGKCGRCGGIGHIQRDCLHKKGGKTKNGGNQVTCWKCKSQGQIRKMCPIYFAREEKSKLDGVGTIACQVDDNSYTG